MARKSFRTNENTIESEVLPELWGDMDQAEEAGRRKEGSRELEPGPHRGVWASH